MSPILQVQVEQVNDEEGEEEEEEEEEEEGTIERVRLGDVLHPGMMIDSLNSSYEDLAGEGGSQVQTVPILNVPMLPSSQRSEPKEKVDGSAQDVNSEADNQNDSSGEEDAGTCMYMYLYMYRIR